MGYLERIFLGSMLLTALLILFLFGLYFDFGAMFVGGFAGNRIGFGQDLEMTRQRRRLAGNNEPRSTWRPRDLGAPARRPSGPVNYDAFVRRGETVPMEVLIEREVRRLKRRGHSDKEFIRMKAVYEVDRSLVSVFDEYDRLIEVGDYTAAIDLLLDAKKHIPEDNPLALRDVIQYLQQAYLLAGRHRDASNTMRELISLQERIFSIENRADLHRDTEGQAYLEKMQEGFGQLREALDKIDTAPPEVAALSPLSPQVLAGFRDPTKKIQLNSKHLRLLKLDLLKKMSGGHPDSLTPEQVREIMSRFEAK